MHLKDTDGKTDKNAPTCYETPTDTNFTITEKRSAACRLVGFPACRLVDLSTCRLTCKYITQQENIKIWCNFTRLAVVYIILLHHGAILLAIMMYFFPSRSGYINNIHRKSLLSTINKRYMMPFRIHDPLFNLKKASLQDIYCFCDVHRKIRTHLNHVNCIIYNSTYSGWCTSES